MADAREVIARAVCGFTGMGPGDEPSEDGGPVWTHFADDADAILAALAEAGLVVVPREPTPEMLDAFIGKAVKDDFGELRVDSPRKGYAAMIAAAAPSVTP